VDVAPTILAVAGVPVPKTVQGEFLLALIKPNRQGPPAAKAPPDRAAYAETDYPHLDFGWSSLRALRTDKYLFIQAPRKELYDQSTDLPAEHNLATTSAAVTQTLADRLDAFRRKTASSAQPAAVELDPRLAQQLAALGYVSANHAAATPGGELTGADPKDKIEIANRLDEALLAQGDGRFEDATRILEPLQAKEPNVVGVARILGEAWLQQENYQKALPPLRKAVELSPESSFDHYRLGQALLHTGDIESAKRETETAIATSSLVNLAYVGVLHSYMAEIRLKMGDEEGSLKELEVAVRLAPDDYGTNLNLGKLLGAGKVSAGLPYLKKAAKLHPDSLEPHQLLADAYAQLGRETEATMERLEVMRIQGQEKP
jgi:predicted Zn-dependent protease